MKRQSTSLIANSDITREWHLIDATSDTFGRVATKIAGLLIGKGKVSYSFHQDVGDYVVVVNSSKVVVSGNKASDKKYYRHSGYIGSIKETSFETMRAEKSEKLLMEAVRRMLPKNKMGTEMLKRLRVFSGTEHPHTQHFSKQS